MINDGNSLNVHEPNVRVSHSNFPQERHVLGTYRFGEIAPFFYFDGVASDDIKSQRSITTTRSFSLKAPLMEDVKLKRDYFAVHYEALLPHNWQKVLVIPKKGDDVSGVTVGCFVENFSSKIQNFLQDFFSLVTNAYSDLDPESDTYYDDLTSILLHYFEYLATVEMLYSNGSLLSTFGIHLSPLLRCTFGADSELRSFDNFFDLVCNSILTTSAFKVTDYYFAYTLEPDGVRYYVKDAISMRLFLSRLREFSVVEFHVFQSDAVLSEWIGWLDGRMDSDVFSFVSHDPFDLSLARLGAYQISCAHFFTNDNVDYIFSAQLWRDYLGHLICGFDPDRRLDYFTYNGVRYPFDWLSGHYFDVMVDRSPDDLDDCVSVVVYLNALFGFNRSLRYVDYFAGARTTPLAVGDTSVSVNDNLVSVVDINRKTQLQRLLNNVMRLPGKALDYVRKMFPGADPGYDYHDPAWLCSTEDVVYTAEVENTGTSQISDPNSITANFRANSSDKEFDFDIDEYCVVIGLQYFDIRRAYYTGVDRLAQVKDRYDMFIPELQYIGDQPIYGNELVAYLGKDPISYTGRNMEYKQVIDQAFGGFVENLPGWAFLFNPEDWRIVDPDRAGADNAKLSPDFIRSLCVELDPYFISISGFSLGSYFHFQQKIVNITNVNRPMVKDPQILG